MLASLTTLTLLALASASPLKRTTTTTSPALSRAKAYNLQVQLLDPSKDLTPSIAGHYIGTAHVGAGQNIAIIGSATDAGAAPFYTNGTSDAAASDVLNDLGTSFPWGINVLAKDASDATYPGEHGVSVNVGGGSLGVGVVRQGGGNDAGSVVLGGPAPGGWAACERFVGYTRSNMTVVRYVYEGESAPADCVGISFRPLCAALPDLPAGSEWTHEFVQEVDCVVPAQ
ncbi:uncharacterized protein GGS25DRAFT_521361 [Hypoxylon fragiforme]|uniref:uncharacterized protein n=1 Tax=Hypoxylon fragiforme TaxID=63214 RepID=UPI0020C697B2|nr:uncharacterized protein GGS25DRAFT_521361 [Hypoxylon fragiforme]KAI2608189.1 hypothetical protein GGS25DRAFT_521361 [Hypoxylon fragiforme]